MTKDRCDVAYDLIHDDRLHEQLVTLTAVVGSCQLETQDRCEGLKAVGSHRISAPDLIKGDMLASLRAMAKFAKDCIAQIESLDTAE